MPRSNKKKKIVDKPDISFEEASIAKLLDNERVLMISRAIVSIFFSILMYNESYISIISRPVLRDMELI